MPDYGLRTPNLDPFLREREGKARNRPRPSTATLVSVTNYVTDAFPRSVVSSGNGDPLAPQAVALEAKLESLGVEVGSLFFPPDYSPPLPHEYQFNLDTPAFYREVIRQNAVA
jgi:acetyl esterase/lipase